MCFSFFSLAAGDKWGSESVGQRSSLQFTAVTRWSTSWKLPFQAPGAGQTSTKSMEKQSFRPHQGLSQIPSFNDEDLYLYSLLHHNMVSQNVCYHSFWKHMYSTYSLVTVDTFFFDFATWEYSVADESSCFQDRFTSEYFGGGKQSKKSTIFQWTIPIPIFWTILLSETFLKTVIINVMWLSILLKLRRVKNKTQNFTAKKLGSGKHPSLG